MLELGERAGMSKFFWAFWSFGMNSLYQKQKKSEVDASFAGTMVEKE